MAAAITRQSAQKKRRLPRETAFCIVTRKEEFLVLGRPGSDLLSQGLSHSTIGAEEFNGRVRDGIGFMLLARTTRPAKHKENEASCERCALGRMVTGEQRIEIFHSPFATPYSPCVMDTENESNQADRTISTGKLRALLHFHIRPINVVVFHDSQGILVLRSVSRLDAFSGYPFRI